MRKGKMEKGITLIALIVTIAVLVILVAVAIQSIENDGIIDKAKETAKKYNESVRNEEIILKSYNDILDDAGESGSSSGGSSSGGSTTPTTWNWTQNGTSVTNGTVTLTVGKTVIGYTGYSGNYTGGWAVLGAENGKLLLVSKANVSSLSLSGKDGYNNGISMLNAACEPYLNSSLADEARSINVEDINRVTGYNPEKTGDGTRYGAGYPYQYGNTVTYKMEPYGTIVYTSNVATGNDASGTSTGSEFTDINGNKLTTSNSIEVISNSYYYYPNTLTTSSSGTTMGIETTSDAYKVLFEGTDTDHYYVGAQWQKPEKGWAYFGLACVQDGVVDISYVWGTVSGGISAERGVRAVISLGSGVNISESGVIS